MPLLAVALVLALVLAVNTFRSDQPPVFPNRPALAIAGRDVSRAGGVKVVGMLASDRFQLDCRGACDDVVAEGGDVKRMRVLGPNGACVLCETAPRLRRPGSPQVGWRVAGSPHLTVMRSPLYD